ncbi:MAG: hypothetical protein K0R50_4464, partial [Eubacterium sp.]|nr:hypothetical protein [Eubacterium sp.]
YKDRYKDKEVYISLKGFNKYENDKSFRYI